MRIVRCSRTSICRSTARRSWPVVRNRCGPSGIFSDQRLGQVEQPLPVAVGRHGQPQAPAGQHPDRLGEHPFEVDDVFQHVDREDAVEPGGAERQPLAGGHHPVGPVAARPHQEHLPAQVAGDGRRARERVEQVAAAAAQLQQPGPPPHEPVDQAAVRPFARPVGPRIVSRGDLPVVREDIGLLWTGLGHDDCPLPSPPGRPGRPRVRNDIIVLYAVPGMGTS